MEKSYWTKTLGYRIGRRRALMSAGGAAAAAAFLAACGGGSDGADGNGGGSSSLITKPRDTFAQAKRGGVLKNHVEAEPRSLDPVNPQADLNDTVAEVYSTLLTEKPGKLEPSAYVLQGQLAESWEVSDDGLQITMKVRPNAKWHNRPPVNGRVIDADDVVFSYNRYASQGPLRSLVDNTANPAAPVLGMTATDKNTIVIKLDEPVAYMANWFACFGSPTGQILMYPKEADGGFDPRQDMIGSGPFMLKEHINSIRFVLQRHPEYWDKDFALVDEIEQPVIGEYAQRLAQLKAGNLYFFPDIRAEDVVSLHRDEPRILLYETEFLPTTTVWTFGHLPVGGNKFADERVRQAVSMSWDRDLFNAAKYNVDRFESEGVTVRTGWNSHLVNRDPFVKGGWFLDPKEGEFGPNAKYFEYNLSEAKKLLSAAGFGSGFDVTFHYPATPQYNLSTDSEPMIGFLQALGLRVNQRAIQDYTNDYIPNDRDASGAYEGIGIHSVTGGIPSVVHPTAAMVAEHLPAAGVTFHGYDINGQGDKSGDPELIAILSKARLERNEEAQKKLLIEAQRYLGKAMHSMTFPGGATTLWPAWEAVQNYRVWTGQQTFEKYQLWLDQTKAPFV